MKKIAIAIVALVVSLTASAQFEQDKWYMNTTLSSLGLHYSGNDKFSFGIQGRGGYMLKDNIMLLGQVGYEHKSEVDNIIIGGGARYYIVQNGLFLGLNANYAHSKEFNDFKPSFEVGYAFFVTKNLTIEPSVYYEQSFKDHNFSEVGFKVALGFYFDKKIKEVFKF